MESFGTINNQVELENHSSPVDYLQQRYASACGNTFNSWNDYLGLSTLVSKAVSQAGGGGFRPGGQLELQSRAPYLAGSLDLSELGLCSHHQGQLLGSDLQERFAQFSPFSGGSRGYHQQQQQQQQYQQQRQDREQGGWNRVDVIMMDSKSHLQLPHSSTHHHHHYQPHPPPANHQRPARAKSDLQICVFCRNNNESVTLYTTHILKSPDGRVLCPILRRYTCPLCGANGDNAHTIKYCPLSKLQPTLSKLKTRNCVSKRVR
uniref:nanos homolog 1-like n=1 Tax=Pristiophorus japonicus TaxID=55135 RepID=UPI00398E6EEE